MSAPMRPRPPCEMLTRMQARSLVAVLVLVLGACGGDAGTIGHPAGTDELVLRVQTGGGLVPPDLRLRELPGLSLFGDGRLVTPGPQIAIYPGPALPSLLERQVSEHGVQAILAAARDAGLFGPDRLYDAPGIMDAPTTVFIVVEDGRRHVISAYALGLDLPSPPGASEGELAARRALVDFQTQLGDLGPWLPQGSLGEERPHSFHELRVFVLPYEASPEPELLQAERAWPLAGPLASFGEPAKDFPTVRCGVVAGDELAVLLPEAQESNQLTPWTSGGERYLLVLRPLLPDEHGC